MEVFVALLFLVALSAVIAYFNSPTAKGRAGEQMVDATLCGGLDPQDYIVISDILLPHGAGTTQIDHLVISKFGLFAIETKNWGGWIFGSAEQRRWTQVLHRTKTSFQNPLIQNQTHIRALASVLNVPTRAIFNVVVFTGRAEPKTPMPENVLWSRSALKRFIRAQHQVVMDRRQMDHFAQIIRANAIANTPENRQKHVAFVRGKSGNTRG